MQSDGHLIEQPSPAMRARVIIAGAPPGLETLTYAIPEALLGRVCPGHRVVVPMRSRRVTGIVREVGPELASGGATLKPILELLEPEPLFDRAHLELIDFLASYYMTSLTEAYRSVLPAAARVESKMVFTTGALPSQLAAAAMTPLERTILSNLDKRAMSARQIRKIGAANMVDAALDRLLAEGLVVKREATRGRHRQRTVLIATLAGGGTGLRGGIQRAIVQRLSGSGSEGLPIERLYLEIPGARAALRRLVVTGTVALTAPADSAASPKPESHITTTSMRFDLTAEQSAAVSAIAPTITEPRFQSFLLWGITGSGKTEVYVQLAAASLAQGRAVIVLVPEIALADEVVRTFRERFGSRAAVVHSAQNIAERWANWKLAIGGAARIVIGPRSAIFAPVPNLGLIVVDEEHDPAYKQEEGIRYNARDLAVTLGRLSRSPVVLGSATPSAESFANARRGRYELVRLTRRIGGRPLASVDILDLRAQVARPPHSQPEAAESTPPVPLAPALMDALRENLAERGQSVIFLNRRGYHNFLQCHLCGNVITCPNCSVSLTYYLRDRTIRCHYCGMTRAAPEKCPACDGLGLEGQGFGTERVARTIAELLPAARIERLDSDTSGRGGRRGAIIAGLRTGTIDIVVGTQMIAKGFDLPGVTLVGVVLADLTLNIPDFRSAERTFQLLTQVAGRAGRGDRPGRVLIQTYEPHHYSIRAARDQDYSRFMRRELELRRELGYPPFGRLALIRIEGGDGGRVNTIAGRVAIELGRFAQPEMLRVLGPAPAPIERIRQRYRWQVMVKSPRLDEMRKALAAMRSRVAAEAAHAGVRLAIDLDPVNMI